MAGLKSSDQIEKIVEDSSIPSSEALVAGQNPLQEPWLLNLGTAKGLGNSGSSSSTGLTQKYRPSIIFLMETKNKQKYLESLRRKGDKSLTNHFYVDPIGIAGGLALWWSHEVDIRLNKFCCNFYRYCGEN